jgi:hypothetical protein
MRLYRWASFGKLEYFLSTLRRHHQNTERRKARNPYIWKCTNVAADAGLRDMPSAYGKADLFKEAIHNLKSQSQRGSETDVSLRMSVYASLLSDQF